ncbi:hypothetical protein NLJ89_g10942 [Agrocybe chaxingu]|uniref:Uncharacterized protein n=1 Tax=Agrocybe chaxingu TaxID=84603 RepID=A0A9W8JMU1_9AGAR|nr:hypothetical protein NLJ89_g10942 [Agrocybe chaxingu]
MRRLEESARREAARRRGVGVSEGMGGWKESTFAQPPTQGQVQKQASRNPFRKRPSLPVSLPSFTSASTSRDPPHPTPVEFAVPYPHPSLGGSSSSQTSSENNDRRAPPSESLTCRDENRSWSRVRPRASFSCSSRDALENHDGSGDEGGRGDPARNDVDVNQVGSAGDKVLKPISAVQVPVLSADLRKEALKKEKELEKSLKRASSTSSLASSGGSARKKARTKTKENVGMKPFDWKGWSKTGS